MASSSSHTNVSVPQFTAIFDAALQEYAQKTGTDLATHPLSTTLEACLSPDAVLGVLREQAYVFDQYRNGDWKVQLMRRLKPTVDILIGLSTSGVFGEGISLVSHTSSTLPAFLCSALSSLSHSNFYRQRRYLRGLVSYCRCVSPPLSLVSLVVKNSFRRPKGLARAMMRSLTCSSVLNTTLAVSKLSQRFPPF
jgi:hypothetical protein